MSSKRYGVDVENRNLPVKLGKNYRQHLKVSVCILAAAIEKARELGIPKVGLLVDKGNPRAEKLYTKVGFEYVNDTVWGGHGMRHLQYTI